MPIKSVNPDVAETINQLTRLLKRDFDCDYAYSILGNGCVLAQSNMNGVVHPTPTVKPPMPPPRIRAYGPDGDEHGF